MKDEWTLTFRRADVWLAGMEKIAKWEETIERAEKQASKAVTEDDYLGGMYLEKKTRGDIKNMTQWIDFLRYKDPWSPATRDPQFIQLTMADINYFGVTIE